MDVVDQARDDVATPCGLTRSELIRLPVRGKAPGLISSVEVALTVSRDSLGRALMWVSEHSIRPIGRQFEGPYPGLLWHEAEIESHAAHDAPGCSVCASIRKPVELKAS